MRFKAFAENAKLFFEDVKAFENMLRGFQKKVLVVDVELYRKPRSNNQNRYYWFCLSLLSNHTGHTKSELHDFFKRKFLSVPCDGWLEFKTGSTRKLNTLEMEEYLQKIRLFCDEIIEYYLPLPNETRYDYEIN